MSEAVSEPGQRAGAVIEIDLARGSVRALNQLLHRLGPGTNERHWTVLNPNGAHAVAVGLTAPVEITIRGHVGYYCGGMNEAAAITIDGHAGTGVAENIMSGVVRVCGNAAQSAAASGRGGLFVIDGDASARCGISMKGVDIVVGGSVGHLSAFMGQAGSLVVCGDAVLMVVLIGRPAERQHRVADRADQLEAANDRGLIVARFGLSIEAVGGRAGIGLQHKKLGLDAGFEAVS